MKSAVRKRRQCPSQGADVLTYAGDQVGGEEQAQG